MNEFEPKGPGALLWGKEAEEYRRLIARRFSPLGHDDFEAGNAVLISDSNGTRYVKGGGGGR